MAKRGDPYGVQRLLRAGINKPRKNIEHNEK